MQLNLEYSFSWAGTGTDGHKYVDIAKDLSILNRKLVRQNQKFCVAGITFVARGMNAAAQQAAEFRISTAADNWVTKNALTKAKAAWLDQRADARSATSPGAKATWEDFKVYLDEHMAGGAVLTPVDADNASYLTGEWDYSELIYDDGAGTVNSPILHICGPHVGGTQNGLIQSYSESRATVQNADPNLPAGASTSIYAKLKMVDAVLDDVIDDMEDHNDEPPYDKDDYPGGTNSGDGSQVQQTVVLSQMELSRRAGSFKAPAGLVKIEYNGYNGSGAVMTTGQTNIRMIVHLKQKYAEAF